MMQRQTCKGRVTAEFIPISCQLFLSAQPQVFAFSYGICAGVRGFLFSILSTRLMEQLRWVARETSPLQLQMHICTSALLRK